MGRPGSWRHERRLGGDFRRPLPPGAGSVKAAAVKRFVRGFRRALPGPLRSLALTSNWIGRMLASCPMAECPRPSAPVCRCTPQEISARSVLSIVSFFLSPGWPAAVSSQLPRQLRSQPVHFVRLHRHLPRIFTQVNRGVPEQRLVRDLLRHYRRTVQNRHLCARLRTLAIRVRCRHHHGVYARVVRSHAQTRARRREPLCAAPVRGPVAGGPGRDSATPTPHGRPGHTPPPSTISPSRLPSRRSRRCSATG